MSDGLASPRVSAWLWRRWHWVATVALLVWWGVVHEQAASLFAQRPGVWVVVDDRSIAGEIEGQGWRRPAVAPETPRSRYYLLYGNPNADRATQAAGLHLRTVPGGGWSAVVDNRIDPSFARALTCDERPRDGRVGTHLEVRQSHDLRALQVQCRSGVERDDALIERALHLSLRYFGMGERTERPVLGPWHFAVVASRKTMNRSVFMVSLLLLLAVCSSIFGRAAPRRSAHLPQSPYRASTQETQAGETEAPHGTGVLFWISVLFFVFTALETRRAMRAPEALRNREGDVPQVVSAETATSATRLS